MLLVMNNYYIAYIIHAYAFFMNKRRITVKNFEKEKKKFMLDTELGQLLFLNYTFLRALE